MTDIPPPSVGDLLRDLAELLEANHAAMTALAEACGIPTPDAPVGPVSDLRTFAAYVDAHPAVAADLTTPDPARRRARS